MLNREAGYHRYFFIEKKEVSERASTTSFGSSNLTLSSGWFASKIVLPPLLTRKSISMSRLSGEDEGMLAMAKPQLGRITGFLFEIEDPTTQRPIGTG